MRTSVLVTALTLVATMAVMGVPACSSEDPSTPNTTNSGRQIRAAEGGTVSDPSGTATLTIPPGALAKDTEITVAVLPAAGGSIGSVYDFGPNGTKFSKPAKLDIKIDAKAVPEGSTAIVAMDEGSGLKGLEGSTYAAGVASAPVAHFTSFAVLLSTTATTDAGTDAPVTVPNGNCAFKGTFTLEKFLCGTTDVTAQWKTVIPTETLVVTDKAGGGCTMVLTHSAPACVEVESFDATVTSGSSYQLAFQGISSCTPAACQFTTTEAACVVGDRVSTETATLTAEGAKFHIVRTSSPGNLCGTQASDILFAP